MTSKHGVKIRERFPEHSSIHDPGNAMRELLEEGIGVEFDQIETDLFAASDSRFILTATEATLELFREWFGLPKRAVSLAENRAFIIAVKTANITVNGIKRVVANILNIDLSEVIVIDGSNQACKANLTIAADRYTGTPCTFAGRFSITPGIVTVKIPEGSDITLIESVISQLVLASVTVYVEEYV